MEVIGIFLYFSMALALNMFKNDNCVHYYLNSLTFTRKFLSLLSFFL